MEQSSPQPSVQTPYLKLWKNEGLMYCAFADALDVTLEVARACVEVRLKFSNGTSYPQLIDMKGIKSIDRQAREYLAAEGTKLITAGALITGSPLNRMLGNLFLYLNKPKVPTKLFTDEKEAREWLKQYLNIND